jgi:integrase
MTRCFRSFKWGAIMLLTKTTIVGLTVPAGKRDRLVFDDALPGFGVRVHASGRAVFIVQYRTLRGQRRLTLGDARKISLDEARRDAKRRLAAVALGQDPAAEKAAARARAKQTLGAVVPLFLDRKRQIVRAVTFRAIERRLARRWAPLHDLPLHEITRRDVAARLLEIERDHGTNPARGARTTLGDLFTWAMGEGLVENNPIVGTNEPPPPKARERVLHDRELAAVWRACERLEEYGHIVRLLILTGARRDEIGSMRWTELDPERGALRIPGVRTKSARELMLPLPPFAWSILAEIPSCRLDHDRRVFGRGRVGFSTWSQAKRELDQRIARDAELAPWVLHDVRRSVATGMAEIGVQPHIIEAVLNHTSGHKAGVAGVYNRATYEREVKAALALWAEHTLAVVGGRRPKVVPMAERRR